MASGKNNKFGKKIDPRVNVLSLPLTPSPPTQSKSELNVVFTHYEHFLGRKQKQNISSDTFSPSGQQNKNSFFDTHELITKTASCPYFTPESFFRLRILSIFLERTNLLLKFG
jgi:hypothetical protein